MSIDQLYEGLSSLYPTRYSHFSSPQEPPFICYIDLGTKQTFADNKVLYQVTEIDIELYTESKDFEVEKKLQQFFDDNELPYDKSATVYIASEELYKITYEVTL